jgi:hypothetical protein
MWAVEPISSSASSQADYARGSSIGHGPLPHASAIYLLC